MKFITKFGLLFVFIISSGNVFCGEQKLLLSKLKEYDQDIIANIVQADLMESWPRLSAPPPQGEKFNTKQNNAVLIANTVIKGLKQVKGIAENLKTLEIKAKNLLVVYDGLLKSGGYVNLILADSVLRIVCAQYTQFALKHSDLVKSLIPAIKAFQPLITRERLAQLLQEDGIKFEPEKWKHLRDAKFVDQIIEPLRKRHSDGYSFKEMEELKKIRKEKKVEKLTFDINSLLLKKKNITRLIWRLLVPGFLMKISLPGFLDYLNRGGKLENLKKYIKDYPLYKKFMGGRSVLIKKYRYTWMSKRGVSTNNIYKLTNSFLTSKRNLPFDIIIFE